MRPEIERGESQTRKRLKRSPGKAKPNKNVVKGMNNELRAQILILLNERVASRPEICKELAAPFDKVRYEMGVLKETDPPLIELVFEKPVRGTVEKFYRATAQAYLDPSEWPGVPDAIKAGMRGSLLGILVDDAVAAVEKGTFDSLENAHMSWTPMILDDQGWGDITAILLRAMNEMCELKEECAKRLIAKDVAGISCTVSILGYPSANEERKVGPPVEKKKRSSKTAKSRPKAKKGGAKKTKASGKGHAVKASAKRKRKVAGK